MPWVEILDGPPEWAGTAYETDEDMVADELWLSHPRWRGTPVRVRWGALYAYRKVEVAGDRHRYRYRGPWPQWRHRHDLGEDLTGWDVLVVQKELESDDPRKLWGSPVRVYAAPPGVPRPDPARPPEEQGWQELDESGRLRRPRAPGTGTLFQERLVRQMAAGNPWVGPALAAAGRPAGGGQGRRGRSDRARARADASGGQGGQGAAAAPTRRGAVLD